MKAQKSKRKAKPNLTPLHDTNRWLIKVNTVRSTAAYGEHTRWTQEGSGTQPVHPPDRTCLTLR